MYGKNITYPSKKCDPFANSMPNCAVSLLICEVKERTQPSTIIVHAIRWLPSKQGARVLDGSSILTASKHEVASIRDLTHCPQEHTPTRYTLNLSRATPFPRRTRKVFRRRALIIPSSTLRDFCCVARRLLAWEKLCTYSLRAGVNEQYSRDLRVKSERTDFRGESSYRQISCKMYAACEIWSPFAFGMKKFSMISSVGTAPFDKQRRQRTYIHTCNNTPALPSDAEIPLCRYAATGISSTLFAVEQHETITKLASLSNAETRWVVTRSK